MHKASGPDREGSDRHLAARGDRKIFRVLLESRLCCALELDSQLCCRLRPMRSRRLVRLDFLRRASLDSVEVVVVERVTCCPLWFTWVRLPAGRLGLF